MDRSEAVAQLIASMLAGAVEQEQEFDKEVHELSHKAASAALNVIRDYARLGSTPNVGVAAAGEATMLICASYVAACVSTGSDNIPEYKAALTAFIDNARIKAKRA